MDPVEAQPRQVFFFDTPDLALNRAGVVVRARRIQGGRGDTVIKLRPVDPADLPADLRRQADFNVEVDVLPGRLRLLGVVQGPVRRARTSATRSRGRMPLRTPLLQDAARVLPAARARGPGPRLADPARAHLPAQGAGSRPDRPRRQGDRERLLVAEMWLYPDGSRILELSTKCPPSEALQRGGRDPGLPGRSRGRARAACSRPRPRRRSSTTQPSSRAAAGDRRPDPSTAGGPARSTACGAERESVRRFVVETVVDAVVLVVIVFVPEPDHRSPAVPVRHRAGAHRRSCTAPGPPGCAGRRRDPRPRRAVRPAGDRRLHRAACSCPRWACSWSS